MFGSLRETPFTLQHRHGDALVLFKVLSCMTEPFRWLASAPSIMQENRGNDYHLPPGVQHPPP